MKDPVLHNLAKAMVEIYQTAKNDLGYNATRFLQMISDHGGLGAARQLLHAPAVSDGFTTLWEHHRLELSVEAHVLRDEFRSLFNGRGARHRQSPPEGVRLRNPLTVGGG